MKKIAIMIVSMCLLTLLPMTVLAGTTKEQREQEETVITTEVPDTHSITIQGDADSRVYYNGTLIKNGSSIQVERLSKAKLQITSTKGFKVSSILDDGTEVINELVKGYYTLEPIYSNRVLTITTVRGGLYWDKEGEIWYLRYPNGDKYRGWYKEGSTWYYLQKDYKMATNWEKVDGAWYYFSTNGKMRVGWQKVDGSWYYLAANGKMCTGWKLVDNKWYYLEANGKMRTGWKYYKQKWYYLKSNGVMAKDWCKVGKYWYYLGTDGKMQTGWQKIHGKYYYFKNNGVMVTGWVKIGNDWYYFTQDGYMYTGWINLDGKNYYLQKKSGIMVKNLVTLENEDGSRTTFHFNGSGVLIG